MTDFTESIRHLDYTQRTLASQHHVIMQHDSYTTDVPIAPGFTLKNFAIDKGVWDPTKIAAPHRASFLFYNNERLYAGKTVLDMGCGTGIGGIVMRLSGAGSVTFADISPVAVRNTNKNVKRFLHNECSDNDPVIESNLFSGFYSPIQFVPRRYDCIYFNHPFFWADPPKDDTIAASMLASKEQLLSFLEVAPMFLGRQGVIVMPFYDPAGPANNPRVVGPKLGYDVKTTWSYDSDDFRQKGLLTMNELRLKR